MARVFLQCSFHLSAPDEAGENPVLAPGDEYTLPFQFHIPSENLPSSVEGNFGHVRYWLRAFIDRPWRFDISTKAFFTVIEHVDINVAPGLLVSIRACIYLNIHVLSCNIVFNYCGRHGGHMVN